ncbi:unnamed protein product [Adineta steineri]|uniref:F-box domain-containing protein n=1 Tax=Adineta steineri TaxID=433720 RepID=A0A815B303_9BILA|nr:unnamed protein product [Adineta steineri]CAF1553410.1 unnamed protein product [Adineta steineri]
MNVETLANELLLDIFEYLPAVYLLRTFHNLNTRLNNLIFEHFQNYRLDFREATKQDFDIICQVNLPLITNYINLIDLSDNDETPQQIELFRSFGYHLNQFPNLHTLSLNHIRSSEIISEILLECPQLIRLSLTGCYFNCKQNQILEFINNIWNLSKLIYCYLNLDLKHGLHIVTPTQYSLSIEHLSIVGVPCRISQLNLLYQYTPHIRYLALDLYRDNNDEELKTSILSINQLNLVFVGPQYSTIENLLQHVPNLYELKIETCYIEINGYDWEQIIRNYLPKLKIFQLKMRCQIRNEKSKQELFNSFQTQFWLKEHQWFIRYHYNTDDNSNMICLYTLPYHFSYLDIQFPLLYKSTCSNNDDYSSYDSVQHLFYRSSLVEKNFLSNFQFLNINNLTINLPINDHLLLIVRKLNRLNLLEISRPNNISDDDAQTQLQDLLDHIPHLYSLNFKSWSETKVQNQQLIGLQKLTPIIIKTQFIQQINLLGYDHWFNDDECIHLSQSSIGIHCKMLYIKVKKQTYITDLIKKMPNLRVLIIRSQDDIWSNYSSVDLLVQWLKQNLSPMCSIKRDSRYIHHIRIWIHS